MLKAHPRMQLCCDNLKKLRNKNSAVQLNDESCNIRYGRKTNIVAAIAVDEMSARHFNSPFLLQRRCVSMSNMKGKNYTQLVAFSTV